jgi:hypothetical protein
MTIIPLYVGDAESDAIITQIRESASVTTFDEWLDANNITDGFGPVARDNFMHLMLHVADLVGDDDQDSRAMTGTDTMNCLVNTIQDMFEYGYRMAQYQHTA